MSSGGGLTTKGLVASGGGGLSYRMRAFDTTLAVVVFWSSAQVDSAGSDYSGPGPLQDIVVQNVVKELVTVLPAEEVQFMPEMWAQENVAASQTGVALSAMVSTNFDTIKMVRAGSIVGMSTRLTEAITAGTLFVRVTINGTPGTLQIAHTTGTGGVATQPTGVDTYVAGDLVGVQITTDSGFLPITTDLEVWLENQETI